MFLQKHFVQDFVYNVLMNQRAEVGREGEARACAYLVNKGYRVVERNHRRPWGELDIVAIAPDGTLVLTEVKTVRANTNWELAPEDEMSAAKVRKFTRAASLYANYHTELIDERRGWRMDVVAIVKRGIDAEIRHYENI